MYLPAEQALTSSSISAYMEAWTPNFFVENTLGLIQSRGWLMHHSWV